MKKNKALLDYIYSCRWCSFKSEITDNLVDDIILESTPFDNGKKFFILGKVIIKGKTTPQFFVMPLTTEKIENKPSLKYKNKILYDALESPNYWSSLMKEITLDKELNLSNGYSLLYQSWDGFDFITKHINDTSKPIGAEQSNSTLIVGDNVFAFKQQRIIEFSKETDSEVEMNYNLMKSGCNVVPKTYGYLSLVKGNGENAFVGIVQEFIPNNGDLWHITKNKLLELLDETYLSGIDIISMNHYKNLYELMRSVGKKTKDLISCLSSFSDGQSLTSMPITLSYIKEYKKNLKELISYTSNNIKSNINKISSDMALTLHEPLKNFQKYTSLFLNDNFSKLEKRKNKGLLMRVHGDFHLGQAIQSKSNEIKFIDFSGEPNLNLKERKTKRSYMYDIAGMYRSINGYLPVVVAKSFSTQPDGNINNEKLLWATEILKPILNNLANAFLNELTIDKEWLELEIFRRNLYEINYEISYRPQMLSIPIDNLKELILKKQ